MKIDQLAHPNTAFSIAERDAVYRAIHERRDMRHFIGGEVRPDVMQRLLSAAHHAPSVGFMQPWRFVRVRHRLLREQVHLLVEQERVLTAQALGEREERIRMAVESAAIGTWDLNPVTGERNWSARTKTMFFGISASG